MEFLKNKDRQEEGAVSPEEEKQVKETERRRKATKESADDLEKAFNHFNKRLFDDALADCKVTEQCGKRSRGYFVRDGWDDQTGEVRDWIAMNPEYFRDEDIVMTLAYLVLNMAKLWQRHFGETQPSRENYVNAELSAKLKSFGLRVVDRDNPVKATGDKFTLEIVPDGAFAKAAKRLVDGGYTIRWRRRRDEAEEGVAKKNGRSGVRDKLVCPYFDECGTSARVTGETELACVKCSKRTGNLVELVREDKAPETRSAEPVAQVEEGDAA